MWPSFRHKRNQRAGAKSPRNPRNWEAPWPPFRRNAVGARLRSGRGPRFSLPTFRRGHAVLDPARSWFPSSTPATNTVPAEWRSRPRSGGRGGGEPGQAALRRRQRLQLALLSSPCIEGNDGEPRWWGDQEWWGDREWPRQATQWRRPRTSTSLWTPCVCPQEESDSPSQRRWARGTALKEVFGSSGLNSQASEPLTLAPAL